MTDLPTKTKSIKQLIDTWFEIRCYAQAEINRLRELCPHANVQKTRYYADDGNDVMVSVLCRDCGKSLR